MRVISSGSVAWISGGAEGHACFWITAFSGRVTLDMGPKDLKSSSFRVNFLVDFLTADFTFCWVAFFGLLAVFGFGFGLAATFVFLGAALEGLFFFAVAFLALTAGFELFFAGGFFDAFFLGAASFLALFFVVDLIKLSLPIYIPFGCPFFFNKLQSSYIEDRPGFVNLFYL